MKTIVQFGAGNIGRGFTGQLWSESGYEVVFVDVDDDLVVRLNAARAYTLRLVETGRQEDRRIAPVRAVSGRGMVAVADELARCAFACTAVGVNVFARLAPVLAAGIAARAAAQAVQPNAPLNILCCENQAGAGAMLRVAVADALLGDALVRDYFARQVGFVDTSVGRMVPVQTTAMRAGDPLRVVAEPYPELPFDADAWRGPLPDVAGLAPRRPFAGTIARKLFTHNGGHAVLAYRGFLRGHEYIWQAAEDPAVVADLRAAWDETGAALITAFGFDPAEQARHQEDLLRRFRNRALGDTIARVARDPRRKLRSDDRLVGGALLCLQHGIVPSAVCRAIAAALRYDAPGDFDDPSAGAVQQLVRERGVGDALQALADLAPYSPLIALVEAAQVAPSGAY